LVNAETGAENGKRGSNENQPTNNNNNNDDDVNNKPCQSVRLLLPTAAGRMPSAHALQQSGLKAGRAAKNGCAERTVAPLVARVLQTSIEETRRAFLPSRLPYTIFH